MARISWFVGVAGLLAAVAAAASPPELTLCFYDVDGFGASSAPAKTRVLIETLERSAADIIVLAGVDGAAGLGALKAGLAGYRFDALVEGADTSRRLALLSRLEPSEFRAITDQSYNLRDRDKKQHALPVRRGFLHAVFTIGDYTLHVLGADLKSRDPDPEFNQTDMRRYEARLLRQVANEILAAAPEANILVLGNLNDSCGNSPIMDVYNRRFAAPRRLYDLRPVDHFGVSWTFWNDKTDEYERLDYAIGSYWLLPEVNHSGTYVLEHPEWELGSSRRPLVVSVIPSDLDSISDERLAAEYPNVIHEPRAELFAVGAEIGLGRQAAERSR